MRNRTTLSLALVAAASFGCFTTLAPPPPAPDFGVYRVGAPDVLHVSILPEPVIERTVTVRPDGRISIDLIGDVEASGRTTEEIAADIQQSISRFKRDAAVTVTVAAARSSTITIFGQVGAPGAVILDRETRLAEAIGSVGGTNIFASKSRIRVIRHVRPQTSVLYADLRAIQYGDLSTNLMLQDGDIVVVPPNGLARVGFIMQTLLFPLQPVFSAGSGAFGVSRAFTGGGR